MFVLERQSKAVDDAAKDLKKLSNAIVVLCLKDKAIEHIVDRFPDKRSVNHEFAVDSVQDGLEVVPLTGILRVKQL